MHGYDEGGLWILVRVVEEGLVGLVSGGRRVEFLTEGQ